MPAGSRREPAACGQRHDFLVAAEEIEYLDLQSKEGTLGRPVLRLVPRHLGLRLVGGLAALRRSARVGAGVEVTWGEANGWHVHLHILLCFAEQVSTDLVAATVGAGMFARWRRALERKGYGASEEHGWDLRRAQLGDGDLADYFVKMAHEVTSGHRKEQRTSRGGRTPMQLLADAVDTYEESAVRRWWAWETASEGRRQLTWSTGRRDLRAVAGLGREATDE